VKGYVSRDGKIGYKFFPKVACTTIKHALYELEEHKAFSPQKARVNIHKYVAKRKISTLAHCERRFVVIRDPIKRFLSAYGNRVTFHKELSKAKMLKFSKKNYHKIPFFNPTLDQFIEYFDIYSNVRSISHHTKSISDFLEGEDLSYFTDVYKIEDLSCFEAELSDLFARDVSFDHLQTGGKKFTLKDLNKNQVAQLLQYYQQDYELLHDYYSEKAIWEEWETENNLSPASKKLTGFTETDLNDKASKIIDKPMISVLLPAYNAEKYICRAIESILSQTYTDFELIIIDDGSTDKTSKVIASSFDDPRINHIILEDNVGIVDALNIAISMAKGKYLARMDADDISMPQRFSKQVEFLESNLEYAVCGASITIFNDHKDRYRVTYPCTHGEIMSALCLFHRNISHPSAMIRSEIIQKHNIRYSRKYPHAEDYIFWHQLSNYGKLYNLKESLLLYYRHEDQISSKYFKIQMATSRDILKVYLKDFFSKENLNFMPEVYINFLVQKPNNENLTLSPAEAKSAFDELLAYLKQSPEMDTGYAKGIIIYKYFLASFYYHHPNYYKVKAFLYGLFSSPNLMAMNLLGNYRLFYFKRIKSYFRRK